MAKPNLNFFDDPAAAAPAPDVAAPIAAPPDRPIAAQQRAQLMPQKQKSSGSFGWILVIVVCIVVLVIVGVLVSRSGIELVPARNKAPAAVEASSSAAGQVAARVADGLVRISNETQWASVTSNNDSGRIVAFTSKTCPACVNMKPELEAAARESPLPIYNLEYDGQPWVRQEMQRHKIQYWPTLIKYSAGTPVAPDNGQMYSGGPPTKQAIVQFAS